MYFVRSVIVILVCYETIVSLASVRYRSEDDAVIYLNQTNEALGVQNNIATEARWAFNTNITDETTQKNLEAIAVFYEFQKHQANDTLQYDWSNYSLYNQRQFEKLAVIGTAALQGEDETTFTTVSSQMETIYNSGTICLDDRGCDLELDRDLVGIMATSNDYELLSDVWTKWRDASGKKMRDLYITYYTLGNKAATLNKIPNKEFDTLDDLWLFPWETPDIKEQTARLWEELRPFYLKLHAYVRLKLNEAYPGRMPADNTIPAHILGNMWAQSWSNTLNTVPGIDPYPDLEPIDVTPAMIAQNYTALQMFQLSDKFFSDLGLANMTDIFWDKSVLVQPSDPNLVMNCHASAWDFYVKDDFRVKQCTKITMSDLITVHHEMGHIEYYIQYQNQPVIYRRGANPGFHEAIGDLLALSVSTPKHLAKLGLLSNITDEDMDKINLKYQLKMALDKVAFLPFGFLMDKYRWDVFSLETPSSELNRHWWELRLQYQGVSPPVMRSEQDFDPGAKYHIPASVEYIRYFVSHILQFQFHKALCSIAEPDVPLHECDIDGDLVAGQKLKEMLELGASTLWPEQLNSMTGTSQMDVQPLLEYFQPLSDFLDAQLVGVPLGWNATVDDYFSKITNETEGELYLNTTNEQLGQQLNLLTIANWNYNTNITNHTSDEMINATGVFYAFQKQQALVTKGYDWSNFSQYNQRQFEKLAVIGTAALEGQDEVEYTRVTNEMETIYSSATVCVAGQCGLQLDPDLSFIMANSTDFNELTEVWTAWRDASGKKMRDLYITYYTLGNKAATLNEIPNHTFDTLDDLWLFVWETPDIKNKTAQLWEQLRPLYEKLHAYVRIKLNQTYPGRMPADNTIPANILGNMWAQSWSNIMVTSPAVDPFPEVQTIDVTDALINQNYTALRMFELSDDFFADLGLERMTDIFWNKSVIVRPDDNTIMVCHASAWDFYLPNDFRIKQCTSINMEDLITIHHEMGHVEYFMQYAAQPVVYRDGANPGFHEAIGDLLALSVSTPKHLAKLGLLSNITDEDMDKINLKYQLKMALDKLAFLPFGFLMDKYRWDVFSLETPSSDLNRHWWELRLQYQGVSPPVRRSEQDFDPGAKFHIPASVEYIRYFVSHILQFQFHKALCDIAQPGVPLYECDIDGNVTAGNRLKEMLELGSSRPWPDQLEILTGTREMDVQPLIDYFKPLSDFLDEQLVGVQLGWNATVDDYFEPSNDTTSTTVLSTTPATGSTPTTPPSSLTPTTPSGSTPTTPSGSTPTQPTTPSGSSINNVCKYMSTFVMSVVLFIHLI